MCNQASWWFCFLKKRTPICEEINISSNINLLLNTSLTQVKAETIEREHCPQPFQLTLVSISKIDQPSIQSSIVQQFESSTTLDFRSIKPCMLRSCQYPACMVLSGKKDVIHFLYEDEGYNDKQSHFKFSIWNLPPPHPNTHNPTKKIEQLPGRLFV